MAASRRYTESGARPSNAGDRFHLVYVARRLLDLLHPYSGLTQLVIENVSPMDAARQHDSTAFLGVDVTEYYGGEDITTAEVVDLIQVKYSSLRRAQPWTRSRLTERKRRGESVFQRLTDMFDALSHSAGTPVRARVKVRLLTNQPLGSQLLKDLEVLRAAIKGKQPRDAGRALAAVDGRAGQTAKALKEASGLSWPRFGEFLAAWDLDAFGHPSLGHAEAELFEALSGFSRDGSERLEVLLSSLQLSATPGQRETFQRREVLARLRLTEDEFYPAPSLIRDQEQLFETRSVTEVRQSIGQGDGWVVLHGPSGCGKTSTLWLALSGPGAEGKAVLYDCFADGQGLRPGNERFPYKKCFTQVINELDARYQTGILATVSLDYQGLLRQLRRSLEATARVAEQQGHRLVLAFDAIDNANEQKRRAPADAGESFVPLLWGLAIPKNCTLIVSLRTENLLEVIADNIPDARRVEVSGFDEEETQRHATRLAPSLPLEEVRFLHQRTAGNPRVQSKLLREIALYAPDNARRLIDETARRTAFDYYDQEGGRRLASPGVRLLLAVLYEMRQAPKLADVSTITGLPEPELRGIIAALTFGLRLSSGERVGWQDQDFVDWTGERLEQEREAARAALADHCTRAFHQDEYARWNLSYHLLLANRLDELVVWWREPGRLDEQIRAAHPYEERVLDDLRAAVLGALRIGQTAEAFDLLLRAADIAEGRDAFTDALGHYLDVAVAANLIRQLPGAPETKAESIEIEGAEAKSILTVAAEFARRPDRRETARHLHARFKAIKQAERVQNPERGGLLLRDEFLIYARYEARVGGIQAALDLLEDKVSGIWSRLFVYTVGSDWQATGEIDPLGVFSRNLLNPGERASAFLGVLSAMDPGSARGTALRMLDRTDVDSATRLVAQALSPGSAEPSAVLQEDTDEDATTHRSGWVVHAHGDAIENLAAARLLEDARDLLEVWFPPQPRYRLHEDLELYLRWAALREALTNVVFNPASYELPPGLPRSESDGSRVRDAIRREMALAYPPLRVRALAWAGGSPEELSREIRQQASSWRKDRSYVESDEVWSTEWKAGILLEAMLAFPGSHIPLAREVIEGAENSLGDSRSLAQVVGADVLSRNERYLGEAERLTRKVLDRCRPPEQPARVAMERLFSIYTPAARINASLARRVIIAARDVAGAIDSRIYARAEAITAIAELALPNLDPRHLDELCAVTGYWWSVDLQSSQNAGKKALGFLAQKDPGAALKRAWELDKRGLLDFEEGLGHLTAGALAGRTILPEIVWPIMPLLTTSNLLNAVARSSIELLHERGLPLKSALGTYCRLVRLGAASRRAVPEAAQDVVAWAQSVGLGSYPEIRAMQAFADTLKATLTTEKSLQRTAWVREGEDFIGRSTDFAQQQVDASPLSEVLLAQIPHIPRSALTRLLESTAGELKAMTVWELSRLVTSFLEYCPLSDRSRLAAVIERWGAVNDGFYGAEVLSLLDSLLGDGGVEEPELVQAVGKSFRRLLTANGLTSLAHGGVSDLLQGHWVTSWSARLDAILEAIAGQLRELGSDTLFSLAATTATLLKSTDLSVVARDFIARTAAEVPILGDLAVPGGEPARLVPNALLLALGHPRQALRWRGVYATVHALVDSDEPESFLGPLLDALDSTDAPRWLSVREWLAFALEHVSLRKPGVLRSVVGRLIPHVISRELPHAKIRHHLKQTLLAIERGSPGLLSEEDLASVKRVNRPVALVQQRPIQSKIGWGDRELGLLEKEDKDRIIPDYMDTIPYWYRPLAECFAGVDIERAVVRKASDWMAHLGITRTAVNAERMGIGDRYKWEETNNGHGSQPQVELLRLYGERHGLYLAAGELIDSAPVLETTYTDGTGNEWDDWARYNLRGADPGLPARLIEAPPPLAENYGIFSSQIADWKKKADSGAFSRELDVSGEADWIVVAGHRGGFGYDRNFSVMVNSALVSPATATALARLLESGSQVGGLPFIKLRDDSILPELESEIVETACRPGARREENEGIDGRFVLKAWIMWLYQEVPLHDLDPLWPRIGRNYALPALDVVRTFGWERHPTELTWRDATGQCVACCDIWRQSDGLGNLISEGHRLVMHRDNVAAYVREVGLDVIFTVRLSRQSRSGYRGGGREDYDPGTTRCFLWSDLAGR